MRSFIYDAFRLISATFDYNLSQFSAIFGQKWAFFGFEMGGSQLCVIFLPTKWIFPGMWVLNICSPSLESTFSSIFRKFYRRIQKSRKIPQNFLTDVDFPLALRFWFSLLPFDTVDRIFWKLYWKYFLVMVNRC